MKKGAIIFLIFLMPLSMYSEKWIGRATVNNKIDGAITSSGEKYKSDSLTGACNGFKLGADIIVINVKNKKAITVKVNDRLQNDSNYFIALSSKAAQEIGLNEESGLVVVDAKFSDINSTERLNVNGLVKEGEVDEETIKNFPLINWPTAEKENIEKNNENENNPSKEKGGVIPDKKAEENKSDADKNGFMINVEKVKNIPEKEQKNNPENVSLNNRMDDDAGTFKSAEGKISKEKNVPEKEKGKNPEELKKKYSMNNEKESFVLLLNKESTETTKKEKLTWVSSLEKNKVYVRFSTTFDKKEGGRRLGLFNQIFPDVVGLEKNGKFILFVGPIDEKDIDKVIRLIRKYGYKDSYVVRGQ